MEFWSELSKKITDAADYTVKETGKLTNITKLKYKLSGLKSKRDQLFKTVGKMKFYEFLGEETDSDEVKEKFEEIKELKDKIESIEDQIAELSNYRICAVCRTKIERNMVFCPRCGAKQESEQNDKTDEKDTDKNDAESGQNPGTFDITSDVIDAEKGFEDEEEKF